MDMKVSQREACRSTGSSRASRHRRRKRATQAAIGFRIVQSGVQPQALDANERAGVLALCNSIGSATAPRAIVATLLDEGQCVASVSTFYRILRSHQLTRERRAMGRIQHGRSLNS